MESSKVLSLWYNLSNETSLAELCSWTLYFHFSEFYKMKKCRSLFLWELFSSNAFVILPDLVSSNKVYVVNNFLSFFFGFNFISIHYHTQKQKKKKNYLRLNNYWMRLSMISWIIKTKVCVIYRSRRLRQIIQTQGFDNKLMISYKNRIQ